MATLDVITLAEAHAAINLDDGDTDHDAELARFVTAVSLRMDALVGPVVNRTITAEVHDGGSGLVFLKYAPVSSITSLAEWSGNTSTTLTVETLGSPTSSNYVLTSASGLLYRRSGGYDTTFASGRGNVVVTYVAGRAANTAAVDARFKTAAAMMLAHLWRKDQGAGNVTFGAVDVGPIVPRFAVPNAVLELLADQLLAPAVA